MAPAWARWLRRGGWIALGAIVALIWLWSLQWQRDTARLVKAPVPGPMTLILGLVATALVFVLVILAARGLRAVVRRGSRVGQRFLRPWLATALAAAAGGARWSWCCRTRWSTAGRWTTWPPRPRW